MSLFATCNTPFTTPFTRTLAARTEGGVSETLVLARVDALALQKIAPFDFCPA